MKYQKNTFKVIQVIPSGTQAKHLAMSRQKPKGRKNFNYIPSKITG